MQLTIEKLVYGGDGLARVVSQNDSQNEPADGKRKTVFVPLVLPGERVEATITEERPGFARATLDRVLEPSPQRTEPSCRYFGACGGCHYQHADYETQLHLKREILRETVARIAKVELPEIAIHASPPLHYRNRTRMKVAVVGGASTKFALGYRKLGSHELLPVRECPISSPLINRAIAAIWDLAAEQDLPQGLSEIEFFADHADAKLLLEFLTAADFDRTALTEFAKAVKQKLPEIAGVAAISHSHFDKEAVAAPELDGGAQAKPTTLLGEGFLAYKIGEYKYRVGAGSFFQTNRHLAPKLVELACAGARGKLAMDLYAGAGLFTLALAQNFERVIAVEFAQPSFADLQFNAPRPVKTLQATTEMFLSRAPRQPDFVVVDPPRAGLGKRVVAGLVKLGPKSLAYVSCDPSTLARDLPGLAAAGYRIASAHLVDLFPQTFHIETVLRMER